MNNLGDLKLSILLEILGAEKNAKQFSASLKDVELQSKKTEAASVRLSDGIQAAGLRMQGFSAIVNILKSTFGSLIEEYNQQEIALSKLSNGLKNVGEGAASLNKLTTQASTLQQITPFADEQINNAQAMLTTFQKSATEIEILTPRILDLAAAYQTSGESGMDLQQVAVMLGKVNEETIGGLRRVGVAFTKEQEEKLKSLKGTEQAIFLSGILDQNFKGMAETVGKTSAGQMKIFDNQVGELRESLGKILSEAILPVLKFFRPLVESLANASEPVKRLTIGVMGLGVAFTVLGTSMGGLPFIIGGIITVLYALSSASESVEDRLRKMGDQSLKTGEVSKGMLKILGELKTSANNTAEAYDKISESLFGMSKAQLENAKASIQAELIRIRGQQLDVISNPAEDWNERINEQAPFLANISKLESLLSEINSRINSVKDFSTDSTPTTSKSNTGTSKSPEQQKLLFLQQLKKELEEIQNKINSQTEGENITEGLFGKKKELEEKIKMVTELNELGLAAFLRQRALKELETIKVSEKRTNKLFDKPTEGKTDTEEEKSKAEDIASQSLSFAQQLTGILGLGADNFAVKFLGTLQEGLSLANSFAQLLSLILGGGSGGIFSLLGLASGGSVPGSGSGDTVPAMLTPGEFVVKKSIVDKIGSGFFDWINGGGMMARLTGRYATGGLVTGASGGVQVVVLDTKISGNDISLSQRRTNKTDSRRKF